ncbi:MAG: DUF192 domain-containing protein [Candidatus Pacebacteria bacterium]|nr:DUF192 domain-containing protein [Candidatus Paceibacterota bacterium]
MDLILKRIQAHHRIVKPLGTLIIIALAIFVGVMVHNNAEKQGFENDGQLIIGGQELIIDIAETTNDRSVGLSRYETLESNQAMLFVFEAEGLYSFWMRDMKFPIDIIWLDSNRQIISIKENARPEDFPESYYPDDKARYVLETVAGFSQQYNLEIGQSVSWETR